MSVQIARSGSPSSITIPIGTRLPLPVPGLGTSREEKVVRALAAAAALQDPSQALTLAEQAVDDPAAVARNPIERLKLDPVLAKVSAVLDQGGGPSPNDEQSAAARAVGVDAALVAVAQAELAADATCATTTEALEWVAKIEPGLLGSAAQAGLRQENIDFVPKTTGAVSTSQLDDIERRLKALEDGQPAVSSRLEGIEGRLKALEDGQKKTAKS
jgi:hypothetical protein